MNYDIFKTLEHRNKMSLLNGGKGDIIEIIPVERGIYRKRLESREGSKSERFLKSRFQLPIHKLFGSDNPAWKGGKVKRECIVCHKEFYRSKYQTNPNINRPGKFCSYKCIGIWNSENKRGINALNWKGNKCISPTIKVIRSSDRYKLWRKSVFERDRWKCLICGYVGGDINAHHIEGFSKLLKKNNIKTSAEAENCVELWLPENGITLCISCHKLKHTKEKPWVEQPESFPILESHQR